MNLLKKKYSGITFLPHVYTVYSLLGEFETSPINLQNSITHLVHLNFNMKVIISILSWFEGCNNIIGVKISH